MKIRILKIFEHKGRKIYIRNFGETFEFMLAIRGEIYASHITLKKKTLQRDYTKLQYEKAIKIMKAMAEAVIEEVSHK